jgi:hypothetical protein
MEWKKILISLAFLFCFLPISAKAVTYLSNCTTLNITGETYVLTNDVVFNLTSWNYLSGTCFIINNDSITLDCQGHTIRNGISCISYGVYTRGISDTKLIYNVTIKNCIVMDSYYDIVGVYAMNLTIKDSKVFERGGCFPYSEGIVFADVFYSNINNVTFENFYWAVDFQCIKCLLEPRVWGERSINITNSKFINNIWAIYMHCPCIQPGIRNVTIFNNYFNPEPSEQPYGYLHNNGIGLEDTQFIFLNTTRQYGQRVYSAGIEIGGNYYSKTICTGWVKGDCLPNRIREWKRNCSVYYGYSDTCTDANHDSFCDVPLTIPVSGLVDYLPLAWSPTPRPGGVVEKIYGLWSAGFFYENMIDWSCPIVLPPPPCRICDVSQMPNNFVWYPIKGICLGANLIVCQPTAVFFTIIFLIFLVGLIYYKIKGVSI